MGGEKEYRKRNALRARGDYFDEWGAKKRRSQSKEPNKRVYRATRGDYATRMGAKPFKYHIYAFETFFVKYFLTILKIYDIIKLIVRLIANKNYIQEVLS